MEPERDPRITKAYNAMGSLGISPQTVKPVLSRLLKLYNRNWELIEEDNFRTLADAIFQYADDKLTAEENSNVVNEDVEPPLKKQNRGLLKDGFLCPGGKEQNVENSKEGRVPQTSSGTRMVESSSVSREPALEPHGRVSHAPTRSKHKGLIQSSVPDEAKSFPWPSSSAVNANPEPNDGLGPKMRRKAVDHEHPNVENLRPDRVTKTSSGRMIESSSVSRDPPCEPHCRVSHARSRNKHKDLIQTSSGPDEEKSFLPSSSSTVHANREINDSGLGPKLRRQAVDHEDKNTIVLRKHQHSDHAPPLAIPISHYPGSISTLQQIDARNKKIESSSGSDHQTIIQTTFDIASSANGDVKVSLTCNYAQQQQNFHFPSADEVHKFAERHCRKFYVNFGTHFSIIKLLNNMCEGFFETIINRASTKRLTRDDSLHQLGSAEDVGKDHCEGSNRGKGPPSSEASNLRSVAQSDRKWVFREFTDITKGTENVKISLLDEIGSEALSQFIYCPENITYESAYVHVSLARISDEDCCRCRGDCVSSSIPCACARDTGGEYAYTPKGLLTEKFLKSCITMKTETRDQDLFYCQDCPLERAKNGSTPEKCKGHLLRKFIKECWRKCRCDMNCGNRVVQRGITRKLQVFLASKGKGWGLRTLEDLPEGAFVCEYVGEILTNIELHKRNERNSGNEKHVYPVLLDAEWATEGVLKDEEALCLDATHYGNVARFINHRCFDGNIIEVPVQVETPDRHYYHVAFFTKRKVDALEELTWDYGIDFDDDSHPIKAFQCRCGSEYCRDKHRQS